MKKRIIFCVTLIVILTGLLFMLYDRKEITRFIKKENNSSLSLYVNEGSGYVSSASIPVGDYYLDFDKTYCEGKGKISHYDAEKGTIKYIVYGQDECAIFFRKKLTLSDAVIALNDGDTTDSYDEHTSSQDGSVYRVVDEKGIRYEGKDPDNYVTFNGETWRIIGAFAGDELGLDNGKYYTKIIREESMTSSKDTNPSYLLTEFNNDYYYATGSYTNSGLTNRDQIAISKFYFGPLNVNPTSKAAIYNSERGITNGVINSTLAKYKNVGIMYASDYIYAYYGGECKTDSAFTSTNGYCKDYNWLYDRGSEWLLNQAGSLYLKIDSTGNIVSSGTSTTILAVRPTLYLKSNVVITGGTGSKNNPYILDYKIQTLSDEVLAKLSDSDYTSSQDSSAYRVVDENGVRYEGKDPDNYVMFNGETWRIIGAFAGDELGLEEGEYYAKIIRTDTIGTFIAPRIDGTTITTLNGDYYNATGSYIETGLDKEARSQTASATYYFGSLRYASEISSANDLYSLEKTNYAQTRKMNVGVMYPSDYAFAMSSDTCYTSAGNYCKNYNWLDENFGSSEWLLNPVVTGYNSLIETSGRIWEYNKDTQLYVRPTVYLKNNVIIISGDGSKENPYILDTNSINLSEEVIASASDNDYISNQDNSIYRVKNEIVYDVSSSAVYTKLTENDYGTPQVYANTTAPVPDTNPVTGVFTYNNGAWTGVVSSMTSNQYYSFNMTVPSDGGYQFCYTMGIGHTYNTIRVRIPSIGVSDYIVAVSASTTQSQSACKDVGYLRNGENIEVLTRAYSSISARSFYFQKTDDLLLYDAGVRYEGKNPNNYITFNGNEEWRIIGTFEGSTIGLEDGKYYTKIIKNASIGSYAWDSGGENDWTNSSLKTYLNGTYLNSLDKGKIATATWYLRGSDSYTSLYSQNWWVTERLTGKAGYQNGTQYAAATETKAAIGIMYPSDYGYAAYGSDCDNTRSMPIASYSNGCNAVDWLATDIIANSNIEWLISPIPAYASYTMQISVGGSSIPVTTTAAVKPTLYLSSDIMVAGGNGSKTNPYIIE